jgi:hypothetical protein
MVDKVRESVNGPGMLLFLEPVGNNEFYVQELLMEWCRAFTILSMILSSSLAIRGFRIRSLRMVSMRRRTTERFQIVRAIKREWGREDTDRYTAADPSCPQAIMQFQHGTVVMNSDLSLSLSPFEVDGRQLQSDPCAADTATYTRYNQSETFKVRNPHSQIPQSKPKNRS